jgi:hypothetical protein
MSKDKDQQIESMLSQEKGTLLDTINSVENLLKANKQLDNSRHLQQKVKDLKKEYPSLPWFERFVHTIAQTKYLFIKNDEEIAEEKRRTNRDVLKYVDNTLRNVGKKNLSLQRIIDTELQAEFNKILTKELSTEQLQRVKRLRESLVNLEISPEKFSQIVPQVYNADEANALHQERIRLLHVQQDLVKLVKANDNIKELLSIKKELAELREELPSTWLDGLKKITAKIKHVFVNTPEQILKDNITHNNEILKRVDKGLEITGKNIEDSTIARKNRLHKELGKLKERDILNFRSNKVEALSNELEAIFTSAVTASQPLSTSQDLAQSQALSSSMPERITPTRPAPLPPTHSVPLQNQDVQQAVGRDIPTPPEALRATQQAANTMIAPPPPPPLPLPQGTQQTTGSVPPPPAPPPQAVEPTASQNQKSAVATPKGTNDTRTNLLAKIRTGIQLKKVVPTTAHPVPPPPLPSGSDHDEATVATVREQGEGKANFLTEMVLKAKLREEKLYESGGSKALEELEKKPPTRSPSPVEGIFEKAMANRYKAFHDDDEPEHADLVKLITENKIDAHTRKKLEQQAGVKNVNELVKFIQEEFNEFDDDYDPKKEKIQKNVIQQLEKIKESLDRGESAKLPSNPVANVDATKGQFPPKLQSAAKVIAGNLPMTPKDGYKTLPPTPSPKLVAIKKEPVSREV